MTNEIVVTEDLSEKTPSFSDNATAQMPDVGHLMELALAKGPEGVDALDRLLDLQFRIMGVQAERALSDALSGFRAECPPVPQSSTAKIATKGGGSYSFTYAPLDVIAKHVRPYAEKHGLSYSWTTEIGENKGVLNVICEVRHRDGAITRSAFPAPIDSPANISAVQKVGGANTYAKRQSLTAALGIVTTTEDADAAGTATVEAVPINADQLSELQTIVREHGVNTKKFVKMFGVESLKDIPAAQFAAACALIRAKKKEDA